MMMFADRCFLHNIHVKATEVYHFNVSTTNDCYSIVHSICIQDMNDDDCFIVTLGELM